MTEKHRPITDAVRAKIEAGRLGISAPLTAGIMNVMASAYENQQGMESTEPFAPTPDSPATPALERLQTETYKRQLLGITIPILGLVENTAVWKGPHLDPSQCKGTAYTTATSSDENPDLFTVAGSVCGNADCAPSLPIRPIRMSRKEIEQKVETDRILSDLERNKGIPFRKSALER